MMAVVVPPYCNRVAPPIPDQVERLISLGIHRDAGLSVDWLRNAARRSDAGLFVIRHDLAPPSLLADALTVNGEKGFVVSDMTDVDEFLPIASVDLPATPVYLLRDLRRGDEMADSSPDEALPAIEESGRTRFLDRGSALAPATAGDAGARAMFHDDRSRRRKPDGRLDARTPKVWLSNGTGRDGRANRDAPKVGWCWAGNRHTWLGFTSAAGRDSTSD
jgi:Family of unknown function (DUF5701)